MCWEARAGVPLSLTGLLVTLAESCNLSQSPVPGGEEPRQTTPSPGQWPGQRAFLLAFVQLVLGVPLRYQAPL